MNVFRDHISKLEKDKKYVVYRRSGKRSRVGALLMSEEGNAPPIKKFNCPEGICSWSK